MMNKIQYRAVPFLDVFGQVLSNEDAISLDGYFAIIPTSGDLQDPAVRKARYTNLHRVLDCAGIKPKYTIHLPTTMCVRAVESTRHELRTGSGVKEVRFEHSNTREYRVNIQTLIDKGLAFAISEAKATRFNKVLEENDELRATIRKLRKGKRRRRA